MTTLLLVIFCAVIMLTSVLGGHFPLLVRLTHLRVQLMMSFVGGLMLAVALLHLLPHAAAETGSLDSPAIAAVVGLLFTFFLIRVFHVHQHEPGTDALVIPEPVAAKDHAHEHNHDHDHTHDHDHAKGKHQACGHDQGAADHHGHSTGHRWSWLGLAVGLSLHTLIDGVALGASVAAEGGHDSGYLPGLATFLAIVLHKPLDAMAITMMMTSRGWSKQATTRINMGFGLMCPLGALAFYFGAGNLGAHQHLAVGLALGFSAGAFLCISLADLLPEIQFHSHDTAKLSVALVAGAMLAFAIRLVEPQHAHDLHHHAAPAHTHEHQDEQAGPDTQEQGALGHDAPER